ncbi:universal stress protein [Zavarzinia compransoris]|uniref:universal stress protein n=1 Tax=Zavarzinia marina TaxID=2911065 RepID=UPI001F16B2A5|nr:universal stress protein [Zavarzinia marina]MCF4165426.1 universal stress protein [Zavarzinia marina]
MPPQTEAPLPEGGETRRIDTMRKFLVVVDNTPESRLALRYAARRALKTKGMVALLYVIEPSDMPQWLGMRQIMREEAREEAEAILHDLADDVHKIAGLIPELIIREGVRKEELLSLIDEDPSIRILVLGAGTGSEGPGPLVSALAGQLSGGLRVPITLVPGKLSPNEVDDIA